MAEEAELKPKTPSDDQREYSSMGEDDEKHGITSKSDKPSTSKAYENLLAMLRHPYRPVSEMSPAGDVNVRHVSQPSNTISPNSQSLTLTSSTNDNDPAPVIYTSSPKSLYARENAASFRGTHSSQSVPFGILSSNTIPSDKDTTSAYSTLLETWRHLPPIASPYNPSAVPRSSPVSGVHISHRDVFPTLVPVATWQEQEVATPYQMTSRVLARDPPDSWNDIDDYVHTLHHSRLYKNLCDFSGADARALHKWQILPGPQVNEMTLDAADNILANLENDNDAVVSLARSFPDRPPTLHIAKENSDNLGDTCKSWCVGHWTSPITELRHCYGSACKQECSKSHQTSPPVVDDETVYPKSGSSQRSPEKTNKATQPDARAFVGQDRYEEHKKSPRWLTIPRKHSKKMSTITEYCNDNSLSGIIKLDSYRTDECIQNTGPILNHSDRAVSNLHRSFMNKTQDNYLSAEITPSLYCTKPDLTSKVPVPEALDQTEHRASSDSSSEDDVNFPLVKSLLRKAGPQYWTDSTLERDHSSAEAALSSASVSKTDGNFPKKSHTKRKQSHTKSSHAWNGGNVSVLTLPSPVPGSGSEGLTSRQMLPNSESPQECAVFQRDSTSDSSFAEPSHTPNHRHLRKSLTPWRSPDLWEPGFRGVTLRMRTKLHSDSTQLSIKALFSRVWLPCSSCRKSCCRHIHVKSKPLHMSDASPQRGSSSDSDDTEFIADVPHEKKPRSSTFGKQCASCGTKKTPLWRDAEDGTSLCNACGIRYKKYRVRCTCCWHIPRKDAKANPKCGRCGELLKFTMVRTKTWP